MRGMSQIVEAVYDGSALHPDSALDVEPNTRVRITVEPIATPVAGRKSFLATARSLNLTGPADWSENFEEAADVEENRAE